MAGSGGNARSQKHLAPSRLRAAYRKQKLRSPLPPAPPGPARVATLSSKHFSNSSAARNASGVRTTHQRARSTCRKSIRSRHFLLVSRKLRGDCSPLFLCCVVPQSRASPARRPQLRHGLKQKSWREGVMKVRSISTQTVAFSIEVQTL